MLAELVSSSGSRSIVGTDVCSYDVTTDIDYTSFLQVVHFRSVRAAGYIANTYSFGSCITGIILGVIIKFHGRYKIWAIIGVPIYILGTGIAPLWKY